MYVEKMNTEWRDLLDAVAGATVTVMGVDLFFGAELLTSKLNGWRAETMEWALWITAVSACVWTFFRTVDSLIEKHKQIRNWIRGKKLK